MKERFVFMWIEFLLYGFISCLILYKGPIRIPRKIHLRWFISFLFLFGLPLYQFCSKSKDLVINPPAVDDAKSFLLLKIIRIHS